MKLSNLEPADHSEVEKWLKEKLNLSVYDKERLRNEELVRFAPFEFYKRKKKVEGNILWRLTLLLVIPYMILLYLFLPIKMIITGEWGYGGKFMQKFHYPWMNKIGL